MRVDGTDPANQGCIVRMWPLALSGPAAKHSPSPSVFAAAFFFPSLAFGLRGQSVAYLRGDAERAQARRVIVDVTADDQLVGLGRRDEGLQSRLDRLRRAHERAGQRLPQLRLFRR